MATNPLPDIAATLRELANQLDLVDWPTLPDEFSADWYSPPTPHSITRGWVETGHHGIDIACPTGTKLYAPANAMVWRAMECTKCTDAKPSSVLQGYALDAPEILRDPEYGYGLGTHVVLRIGRDDLPKEFARLNQWVLQVYITYGHMKELAVAKNDIVAAGGLLGLSGNTGNSTGDHLHLQVNHTRFSAATNIDPARLFSWRI